MKSKAYKKIVIIGIIKVKFQSPNTIDETKLILIVTIIKLQNLFVFVIILGDYKYKTLFLSSEFLGNIYAFL